MNVNQINTPYQPLGKERILWVDFAKSLGIFLIFWGHTLLGSESAVCGITNRVIYSFHVPMFFLLSGYVMKSETSTFGHFIRKRFKKILLPAFFFYVLTIPIYFIYNVDWSTVTVYSIIDNVFYLHGVCAYNRPLWFFFCLFQILILVKILDLSNARTYWLIIVGMFSLVLSYVLYTLKKDIFSIFGFNKCVLGLFFYVCGMLLRKIHYNKYISIIGICAIPIWILSGLFFNPKVSMHDMVLGNYWLFILSGIAGSLAFFAFCKLFEKNAKIREYAKWTVFIISSHYVLVSIFHIVSVTLSIQDSVIFVIVSFCFVLLSFIIYKPVCRWLETHCPVLIGK